MAGQPAGGKGKTGGKPRDFDVLRHNLGMATALQEFLASAYGPGGRAKLVQDPEGTPIPTGDGARMLQELGSDHPLTNLLRATAAAQEEEWGDGTKLAVLTALCLLRRAKGLLEGGLRPPHIVQGYEAGVDLAVRQAEALSLPADPTDEALLRAVAATALGRWIEGEAREELVHAVVRAARHVAYPLDGGWRCDRRDVHLFAVPGSSFSVELVEGYVLKRFPDDPRMPKRVENAKIALFDAAPIRGKAGIQTPRLRWLGDTEVQLSSPGEIEAYEAWGAEYTQDLVDGLARAGANVVLCRLGISDLGHKRLADAGIMGIRRIMKTWHMEAVARATGAAFIKDFREVRPEDLGQAALVEERRYGGEKYLVITGGRNPREVSLLILGPGEALAGQYEEQAQKALGALAALIEDPRLVPGGAGIEMAAARHVRREAASVGGRAQLATEAFAGAMEDLAGILAENLGLDALDAVLALRHRHAEPSHYGLMAGSSDPVDLAKGPVRDPLALRLAAWRRAVEVCRTVLRVDDVHRTAEAFTDEEKEREKEARQKSLPEKEDRPEYWRY